MSKINIHELAKQNTSKAKIDIKIGRPENQWEYQEDTLSPVHTAAESRTELSEKTGNPQLVFSSEVESDDGAAVGRTFWIDLPIENSEASEHENAAYINKSGEQWLKFLRAIMPEEFNAFARVDKSDDNNWKYYDKDGKEMDFKARKKAATVVSDAALVLAQQCWDGKWTPDGEKFRVYPRKGQTGRLFFNFNRADQADETSDEDVPF